MSRALVVLVALGVCAVLIPALAILTAIARRALERVRASSEAYHAKLQSERTALPPPPAFKPPEQRPFWGEVASYLPNIATTAAWVVVPVVLFRIYSE